MKKTVFCMVMTALSIMMGSCYQENKSKLLQTNPNKEFVVSAQTAQDVAFFYLHKNENVPNTRGRQMEGSKVKNSFAINDNSSMPVMHVINYEGGGFAIISGDNRIEPMLAYADEGAFSENELDYPEGLTQWINHIKSVIGYIRDNNVAVPKELISHWQACEMYGKSRVEPDETLDCEHGEKVDDERVGPLLSSMWDQDIPYNIGMPLITCEGTLRYAYVGCQHLAVAQILHYWEYPTDYNWNNMPNNDATNDTWRLFDDIHEAYEQYDEIDYECGGTTGEDVYIPGLLINDFGYRSAVRADYNYNTVKNELLAYQRPVLLRGVSTNGHVWVCDGAHYWTVCNVDMNGNVGANVYLHFHMNWGWGGDYNGWYSSSNFNIPGKGENYNSGLRMIYNIVPN